MRDIEARDLGDRTLRAIEFSPPSPGHRSSKHERFTPLSRPLSWQLPCERDDPIRTMLPCQHLVIFDAAQKG
jgi:hypothetical protein